MTRRRSKKPTPHQLLKQQAHKLTVTVRNLIAERDGLQQNLIEQGMDLAAAKDALEREREAFRRYRNDELYNATTVKMRIEEPLEKKPPLPWWKRIFTRTAL